MLDIRFVRENPEAVKENIRKKFQDAKLPLVDEVIKLDAEYRAAIGEASDLRANRNKLSKQIGALMGQAKKDPSKAAEAEEIKKQVTAQADRLKELEVKETELQGKIQEIMYTIPQMIDPSVPIGPDDSCNVEVQRFGEPVVPDYPIPYHVDIMESFDGIDLGGLVLEIFIQNCDGTRYKKRHAYPKPWCNHEANGKSDMRKLKIHKTISKRNLNNQEGKDSEGIRIPELRPKIDLNFLR